MGCIPAEKKSDSRNRSVKLFILSCCSLILLSFVFSGSSFAAPPVVTITSPAEGLTNDNTPLLTYSVSEGDVVVKVDGDVVSKVSGDSFDALNDGQHIVRVEATNAGMETGFAEVTFTVDTTPPGLMVLASISSGMGHTVMLRSDGTLWAMGVNGYGQLGDGTCANKVFPVQINVQGETNSLWTDASAGWQHTLAIKSDGTLWAWGYNGSGQLGGGSSVGNKFMPYEIDSTRQWISVAAGSNFSLAVDAQGAVYAWGDNTYGQMGDGSTTSSNSIPAVPVIANGGVAVAAGYYHALALLSDGTLYTWGYNANGQVGNGSLTHQLTPYSLGGGWARITAGGFHSLAMKTDNKLWAWGGNWKGQIGNNSINVQTTPFPIGGASTWSSIAAGIYHSLAVKSDGTLWGWGSNDSSQVDDNAELKQLTPFQIGMDTSWKEVAGGAYHSVALKSDGTLWAWGDNMYGIASRSVPGNVVGDAQWNQIATGYYHSAGIKTDGSLWTWGYNKQGALGDNSLQNKSSPFPVQDAGVSSWIAVAAGALHTLAIGSNGTLWAGGAGL